MVKFIKSFVLYIRCKRAIQRAKQRAVTTGKKQLVIMYGNKPIVMSKQHLKKMIKDKVFQKGFTSEQAENLAIFKTT